MKLSYESKLTLARLLITHNFNILETGTLRCAVTHVMCDVCKVRRVCNAIETDFLQDPYYINNHPELLI